MKKCSTCKEEKKLEEFGKKSNGVLSARSSCKKCECEKAKKKYHSNEIFRLRQIELAKIRNKSKDYKLEGKLRYLKDPDYYKKWYKKNPELVKKKLERQKIWRLQNPEKPAQHAKTQRAVNSEKCKARTKVKQAVKMDLIFKPDICSKCSEKGFRIEGHHEDYSKPLEVIWLCDSCHRKLHNSKRG